MKVCELLLELMKIESFSGNEKRVADYIVSYLEDFGFDIEKQVVEGDRYNIIAKKGEPKVFLSAHMDTVGGTLEMREDSEKIYGRGSCDTKGSIASMLIAGANAIEKGVSDFGYLFTVGEEDNLIGARTFVEAGNTLPLVIVGEPTSLRPINGHYGILVVKVVAKGKAAHTSNPELGENAIEKIMEANKKILSELEVFTESSLTLAKINGGVADNIVPDYAEAIYSMRISPNDDNDYVARFKELVEDVGVTLKIGSTAMVVPDKLEFLGEAETVKYCSDLSFLKNGFLLGPGDIANAHGEGEFVLKEELNRAVEIYGEIIRKMISE